MKKMFIACFVILLAFTPLHAKKDKAKNDPPDNKKAESKPSQPAVSVKTKVEIGGDEKTIIHAYYAEEVKKGGKKKSLPPGLAKKDKLPPGWQKKMARGEVMPAEVYKQAEPLPKELAVKLPPSPPGVVTVVVEGRVVRLLEAELTILDVFEVGVSF